MAAPRPFVVLSTQRSGSSWLVDLLDSHPSARVYSEIFLDAPSQTRPWNEGLLPPQRYGEYRRSVRGVRPFSVFRYLDLVAGHAGDVAAVGFKLMYNHWQRYPEIGLKLAARGDRVVHLVRRNAFDAYLSGLRVRRTGVPHAVGDAGEASPRLEVDVADCLRFLRRRRRSLERVRGALRLLRLPTVEVGYEAMRSEPERELARVAAHLELPPHDWSSRFRKLVREPHEELVSNWDEVRGALGAAGYGEYLA